MSAGSGLMTHPDKVYFAERGETKADLAEYYQRIAEPLLRAMGGRPVLLQRFPEGASGPSFFQKRVPKTAPGWLRTTTVATPNGAASQAPAVRLVTARQLEFDHIVMRVEDDQQRDVAASTLDAGRLRPLIEKHAETARQLVVPGLVRHLRAVGVDPGHVPDVDVRSVSPVKKRDRRRTG